MNAKFEPITVLQLGKSSYRDETFWYILENLGDFESGNKYESRFCSCIKDRYGGLSLKTG